MSLLDLFVFHYRVSNQKVAQPEEQAAWTLEVYPYPGGNVYGGTKAFVRQFSLNLRADLVGLNVRVTDIEPGLVGGSEFSAVRFGGDVEKAAAVYAGTQPLMPEDIAETAAWLVSLPPHVNINTIEMMPT